MLIASGTPDRWHLAAVKVSADVAEKPFRAISSGSVAHIHLYASSGSSLVVHFSRGPTANKAEKRSITTSGVIADFLDPGYTLKKPMSVTLEIYDDEVLAIVPELELYGEGSSEIGALDDLEAELLDLYEYLKKVPKAKLGSKPRLWKTILDSYITERRGH